MRVLIAGCGYVGSALAQRLVDRGDQVYGLRRDVGALPDGVVPISADLSAPRLPALPLVDQVVIAIAASGHGEAAYRAAYLDAVAALMRALEDQPTRPRLLFTSSTSVYGQTDGGWVDESTPPAPAGFAGEIMLAAERQLLESPFPATCVRFGGIYGPTRTRLVELVRSGRAYLPQGPPRYTNRIHRDDCAGSLAHLLTLEAPEPLYIGCDSDPATLETVYRWLAHALDAAEPALRAEGDTHAQRRATNKRCSNRRLLASGYRLRYPSFRDGYRPLLEP